MIGVITSLTGGAILRNPAVLLIPLIYLVGRRSRDLTYLLFVMYTIITFQFVEVKELISYETIKTTLMAIIPSLLALKESIEGKKLQKTDLYYLPLFFLGVLRDYFYYLGLIIAGLLHIENFHSILIPAAVFSLIISPALVGELIELPGEYISIIMAGSLLVIYLVFQPTRR
ncbi:hypothetical protein PFDSM3638_01985 [Pyrococcus furiosus DSM 3638]|uniref:Uncharacterized protein n=3 Tax=Pyrococcus furiosus TaxID=2261 RepID=Q8U3Q3_PYRFU|nr:MULTISPECIES: hypothetical protein [Pyrococcus]AAL80527.1 hypothetical protein PF0403 [Pyrococcus furiosus DSM 3638]AFN03194.1 hypothetical protein PFC_01105 [Pyrococcus furiosus COM1]MDK2869265.1 hypothetical protein [Pyrococcus sp.]QEK78119.1 hypothetical protein PFDSM3638_01985 [Pyrococcus furiosus DSM 3638]